MLNMVLVNGVQQAPGRYPDLNTKNKGYLTIDSYNGHSQITDAELPQQANWTGAELVIRKNRWVLDWNIITRHSGNTLEYQSASSYDAAIPHGYFIQNHPATLNTNGEWYYDNNNRILGIFLSANPSSQRIEAATVNNLVSLQCQSNLTFIDLIFSGANGSALLLQHATGIKIINCEIRFSGVKAVDASDVNDLFIQNCSIDHTNNVAINGFYILRVISMRLLTAG